jgi:predicted cobalt transporter CbtA
VPAERLIPVLKAALVAGLLAGLVMGLFHLVLTEPVIDRAIALEESGAHSHEAPMVSRGTQKVMLIVGSALYGLLIGIIFAVAFAVMGRRMPGRWPDIRAVVLAGLMWWSVALIPFLKYPANPPGVGEPETVFYRQGLMLGFIALSALAMAAAGLVYWLLGKRWHHARLQGRWLGVAVVLYGVLATTLLVLMPADPDPVTAPADLVWQFRILSLSGQVFFWAVLGGASALLLRRFARQGALRETG